MSYCRERLKPPVSAMSHTCSAFTRIGKVVKGSAGAPFSAY